MFSQEEISYRALRSLHYLRYERLVWENMFSLIFVIPFAHPLFVVFFTLFSHLKTKIYLPLLWQEPELLWAEIRVPRAQISLVLC